MKKLTLAMMAFAAIVLASCGNKTEKDAEGQDSAQTFVQEQLEAAVKMQLDSIASAMNDKQYSFIKDVADGGKITLTADEKKVKPDYLLQPSEAKELVGAMQKYAALGMLMVDRAVANLYEMDVTQYDEVVAKLIADVNDPALKTLNEAEGTMQEKYNALYASMDEEGRINFFWMLSWANCVEDLYIISQNMDKYLTGYTDEQVANITFRLQCIIDAVERMAVYDPEIQGLTDALQPLKKLNSISVDQFKKDLAEVKDELAESRKAFLK